MDASLGSPHSFYPGTHSAVGAMAEVAALNRSDLEDLLACDDKLTEFVLALPQLAAARNQCDQLAAQNEAVATANLERSSDYERSRDAVIRKVEELNTLRARFEELTVAQQVASEKLAPSNIQESLLIHAVQSEEESEKIAESFLRKSIDVDTFLGQYLEKRIETHLKKFKGDRLGAQLQELHKAGF